MLTAASGREGSALAAVGNGGCGGSQPPVLAAVERGRVKCQKAALRALYWSELSEWTCSMPKPVPLPPPGFDDLSVDEKIDYLQSLWDRVAATPEAIPVPGWHRDILDERLKNLEANPAGLSERFLSDVDRTIARIRERPFEFPAVSGDVRRALLHTFPYAVYFRTSDAAVVVLAVLHLRRNSKVWRGRAR